MITLPVRQQNSHEICTIVILRALCCKSPAASGCLIALCSGWFRASILTKISTHSAIPNHTRSFQLLIFLKLFEHEIYSLSAHFLSLFSFVFLKKVISLLMGPSTMETVTDVFYRFNSNWSLPFQKYMLNMTRLHCVRLSTVVCIWVTASGLSLCPTDMEMSRCWWYRLHLWHMKMFVIQVVCQLNAPLETCVISAASSSVKQ